MSYVVIAGSQYDAARDVKVNLRMDGSDASFDITLEDSANPLLFARPSSVQIYEEFGGELMPVFDGFLADVANRATVATVQCVDGKKFLEGTMLESDYGPATDSLLNHATSLLATARSLSYYAPPLDCRVVDSATANYQAGMSLKSVFDELFKQYEWRVHQGVLEAWDEVGTDRRESVLIVANLAVAETDLLGIANVIYGTSDAATSVPRDSDSILTYGYARGTTERVDGLSGAAFTDHVQGVLEQKRSGRVVWTARQTLAALTFLEAGDQVSVDIPATRLNDAPSDLRVTEVAYDFTANTQIVTLSTDAKKSKVALQRLKELEEKVRILQL